MMDESQFSLYRADGRQRVGTHSIKLEKRFLCDVSCQDCSGPEPEDCTSCPETRFFDGGRCSIHCRTGRFPMGRQCYPCHHTCNECNDEGPNNCTSCDKDEFGAARYLFQGRCRYTCPEGFFPSVWKECDHCGAACLMCRDENRCINCSPGHKLKDGHCILLQCNKDEVANAEEEDCLHCDKGCMKCKRKTSQVEDGTVCLKCEDGYYQLGPDCHESCPDRTYSLNDTMKCVLCEDKNCEICDQSQCHLCEAGFYIFDGECVDHCKEGFFKDEEGQECEPCHRSCRSCGGPQFNDCDSCEDGYKVVHGECLEEGKTATCPETHFKNSADECELCHDSCQTCTGGMKNDCKSCKTDYFLTAAHTCMSHCPSGTFANKTSSKCQECSRGCVKCQDTEQCHSCLKGLHLQKGVCVDECQRGFSQGGECQPCAPECMSCQGDSSRCLSCEKKYFLLDHSCNLHCPRGYYAADTECLRCPAHCDECNEDGFCKTCADYFFLHEDKCVDDCPDGYFASDKEGECLACHAKCASCDGPRSDDCVQCNDRKAVRYNGECLDECPTKTYYDKNTNECRVCDSSCLTCSGHDPSSCLSCDTKRHKDASGHCVLIKHCSVDSYMDQNEKCQPCHQLCHHCSGPDKDHCLTCKQPLFLLNSTCVQECPAGYYAGKKDEPVCGRCHISCESCVGPHSLHCVSCKPGFFKQGTRCVKTCSEKHFGNTTTMLCDRCDPSCSQCRGPGNKDCLTCREGYVYLRQWQRCLKSCPPSYYQDGKSNKCHKCHPTCKTCSGKGALACQTCYEGYKLMAGMCESQCLVGFYAALQSKKGEQDCRACDSSCVTCKGPSKMDCTGCLALQIVSDDGRCLSCCRNETRHDGKPIAMECCDCQISRDECIMDFNFLFRDPGDLESSTAKLFVTACVFLIVCVGGGIFLFLSAQSKSLSVTPNTKPGGYVKLDTNGAIASQHSNSSYGEYNNQINGCKDGEDENDEEEDVIVCMGKDGTVYRKFKYGFLDEDDIELEYDDESYSYS